ncbi:iron complex transport system substrate-binding protein [Sphingobacterium nematocida]|uniref:Iron complex transport system substrate-binding protein n=1 Tax=Sphingobacterium nematocida TaxID=1513896 RepID=A0A1T5B477_9SPHI|nr:ABC transporter substrate-binding protein [Sphingobacterium nematocida]SKB42016.1 iron complex transport system substrate-binding protein [Sphingobacterium nematocida]
MKRVVVVWVCMLYMFAVKANSPRIITLSSSITETVYGLGLGKSVVATDVTSVSPKAAAALPRVSKNRSVSAEGILAFKPTIVLAIEGEVPTTVVQQIRKSGIKFVTLRQDYSVKGTFKFIQDIADALGETAEGRAVVERTRLSLDRILEVVVNEGKVGSRPKVLFIYARGTGTMSVAGKGSSLDAMIELAGGKNAIQEFSDFKPYTTESLVDANPDIILMFDFGVSSIGGKEAMLKLPGVRITEAGKHKRILVMNPSLLVNFSTRLPEAVMELHKGMVEMMNLR